MLANKLELTDKYVSENHYFASKVKYTFGERRKNNFKRKKRTNFGAQFDKGILQNIW